MLTSTIRFDFFLFEFRFETQPAPRTEMLFLPERVIPDEFYTSEEKEMDFSAYPEFANYRIPMDGERHWVQRIRSIIEANQTPRADGDRPLRSAQDLSTEADRAPKKPAGETGEMGGTGETGQREYKAIMELTHRRFFYRIMAQCAKRYRAPVRAVC